MTTNAWHTRHNIDTRLEHRRIVAIGTSDSQHLGHASLVDKQVTLLLPNLPRSVESGPVWPPLGGGRYGCAIDACPPPQVALAVFAQKLKQDQTGSLPDAIGLPVSHQRQDVIRLSEPSFCGRSSHEVPMPKTNNMPLRAARFSTRGRPPLAEGAATGNSGSCAFHSSLQILLRAMLSLTRARRLSMKWFVSRSKDNRFSATEPCNRGLDHAHDHRRRPCAANGNSG